MNLYDHLVRSDDPQAFLRSLTSPQVKWMWDYIKGLKVFSGVPMEMANLTMAEAAKRFFNT